MRFVLLLNEMQEACVDQVNHDTCLHHGSIEQLVRRIWTRVYVPR